MVKPSITTMERCKNEGEHTWVRYDEDESEDHNRGYPLAFRIDDGTLGVHIRCLVCGKPGREIYTYAGTEGLKETDGE